MKQFKGLHIMNKFPAGKLLKNKICCPKVIQLLIHNIQTLNRYKYWYIVNYNVSINTSTPDKAWSMKIAIHFIYSLKQHIFVYLSPYS